MDHTFEKSGMANLEDILKCAVWFVTILKKNWSDTDKMRLNNGVQFTVQGWSG